MKIIANILNTNAGVPEITWVKYNTPTMTAISMRITLSAVPMFFFIVFVGLFVCGSVYLLPGAAIDYVRKAVLLQDFFCLAAAVPAQAKDNNAFLALEL